MLKYNLNKYCYTFDCNQTEAVCDVLHLYHRVYTTFSLLDRVSNKERNKLVSEVVLLQ